VGRDLDRLLPDNHTKMSGVKEYKIDVPQQKLDRLKRRLDDAEFPDELEDGPGWDYGAPV
jgi:hypothetical protein